MQGNYPRLLTMSWLRRRVIVWEDQGHGSSRSQQAYHAPAAVLVPAKGTTVAALLELIPGFSLQTFGIGHFYAGSIRLGLLWLFGYWVTPMP